jgi:hypothetical protein
VVDISRNSWVAVSARVIALGRLVPITKLTNVFAHLSILVAKTAPRPTGMARRRCGSVEYDSPRGFAASGKGTDDRCLVGRPVATTFLPPHKTEIIGDLRARDAGSREARRGGHHQLRDVPKLIAPGTDAPKGGGINGLFRLMLSPLECEQTYFEIAQDSVRAHSRRHRRYTRPS